MDIAIEVLVGIIVIVLGYLIGYKKQINLVHSYHYKRVTEENKDLFCKGVGCGNVIVGVGIVITPVICAILNETIASYITMAFVVIGLVVALYTIIKYNKGLF